MEAKVAAAVAARRSADFLVIARTDAGAVHGLDAALARARRYRDAGADMLFVEAPQSRAEIERVAAELDGVPLLFNYAEGGKTPAVDHAFLRACGYRVVIHEIDQRFAAVSSVQPKEDRDR